VREWEREESGEGSREKEREREEGGAYRIQGPVQFLNKGRTKLVGGVKDFS